MPELLTATMASLQADSVLYRWGRIWACRFVWGICLGRTVEENELHQVETGLVCDAVHC